MVKKEQYLSQSDQQQDSYFSQDKYQPDPKYQQSSDDDQSQSQGQPQQYSQEYDSEQLQQNDSQEVQQKLSILHKQQQRIKQQLKQLPYGLILKQRQQLQQQKRQITHKIHKQKTIHKIYDKNQNYHNNQQNKQKEQPKDKHAPKQVSIHKKPPKKTPVIFQSSRGKSIDPRFEDYAGHYNEDLAKKTLDFIPKLQEQEIKAIRKTLDQSKGAQKNSRNKKKLSQHQRKVLIEQYNKLTNEKRQNELSQIEKQAKRNIRNQQQQQQSYRGNNNNNYNHNNNNYNHNNNNNHNNNYNPRPNNNYNDNQRKGFIPKHRLKDEFQKVKQSKMSDQHRKEYLKNKEKNIYKNQQVDRNNMMYETSSRFKARQKNGK